MLYFILFVPLEKTEKIGGASILLAFMLHSGNSVTRSPLEPGEVSP